MCLGRGHSNCSYALLLEFISLLNGLCCVSFVAMLVSFVLKYYFKSVSDVFSILIHTVAFSEQSLEAVVQYIVVCVHQNGRRRYI